MNFDAVLEVAIGIVMIWLLSSLAVMQLQEWLASILKWRAKELEQAIVRLLTDEQARGFYDHALVVGLSKAPAGWQMFFAQILNGWRKIFGKADKKPYTRPSYIPPEMFAKVVFEWLINAGTPASPLQQVLLSIQADVEKGLSREEAASWDALLSLTKKVFVQGQVSQAAKDTLRAKAMEFAEKHPVHKTQIVRALDEMENLSEQIVVPAGKMSQEEVIQAAHQGLQVIARFGGRSDHFVQSMESLLRQAELSVSSTEDKIAVVRRELEAWFNNSMDRLSGWYKRKMQLVAFILALLLMAGLNIDSFIIAKQLWIDPSLRDAVSAYAVSYMDVNDSVPVSDGQDISLSGTVNDFQNELAALEIPIGWRLDEAGHIVNLPKDTNEWLLKILGILVSAAAATQGAPFWFDILSKLVNVRGAGVKPQPSEGTPVG